VTRVTAGGRQLRFRASVVIGNGKGTIGFGTGKAGEVQGAIEKAVHDAKKHLVHFPIVSGTIPHDVTVNFKSSSLFIHPARPGTGIIAWGAVRKVFAVSGLKDIIAKQHGAPNKITNAQVAILALQALKPESANNSFVKKQPWVSHSEPAEDQTKETPLKHDHTEKKTKSGTSKKSADTSTTNQ
jgi:small subunit ribosomal protein S5